MYPTDPFTIVGLLNPSDDVYEIHIIRQSADLKALKLWKGRAGTSLWRQARILWQFHSYTHVREKKILWVYIFTMNQIHTWKVVFSQHLVHLATLFWWRVFLSHPFDISALWFVFICPNPIFFQEFYIPFTASEKWNVRLRDLSL